MNNTQTVHHNQKMVWEPYPRQLQVGSYLAKIDGKKLPNSITEDIRGYSLCPSYSFRQLRDINRLKLRKNRDHGYPQIDASKESIITSSNRKNNRKNNHAIKSNAFGEEADF